MSENRRVTGRFHKGQSGNPGGRPKVEGAVRALAQKAGLRAIKRLIELIESDSPRVAVTACQAILDRAYGKPRQSIEPPDDSNFPSLIRVEFVEKP
jgi:hypothetical protein